ncbi:hypothetical protein EDD85DRAFT_794073 [Armillaria nabsnona]|nr:hypothetical protein EDD85DRAFT_794073 [Armillaria nabsnona]
MAEMHYRILMSHMRKFESGIKSRSQFVVECIIVVYLPYLNGLVWKADDCMEINTWTSDKDPHLFARTTDGSDISPQAGHCDPPTATGLALLRLLLLDSGYQMLKVYVCRSCLQFAISQGFHFDKFSGTVTVRIPITISWHRDVLFVIAALDIYSHIIATTQTFNVAPNVSLPIPIESVISSTFSMTETGQLPSDSMESVQITGSLVFLLIILGGSTFLFIQKQRYGKWNLKHRLSPNPKIIPQPNLHSPPVGNKNCETISPRWEGDMTVNLGDRSWETVEHSQEGNLTEVERERRNSISVPDTLESQSVQQKAALDIVAEVLRLRNHVQQIIEQEAEAVQSNLLDPPPAYV